MAKTKQAGKTAQHTTRPGKRLGVKIFGGQSVKSGAIIVRQRGSVFHPARGVGMGRDHTLYAMKEGRVVFKTKLGKQTVSVES
ncbi:MAG: 50S ribosomal protein L27 [Candidatus Chisholmbacteria bacterium RIFCSPLOWO2_01_FULL_50_28]|uniref:Large ribosomal subunit protein bL27 n=1 Tax=Candidatus Chisholmbacteria bacterium RIFCSPHIGHO2_01_FULL_52_32 TaxID=1797591 RepID=A0A1G1VSR5_9BACT|nr:MAG: 50S ribosomal protein L27 [Candidatus Chisholmbacteria bacterium RIFCSPHIGHO2_01_FULL_52_32]OGY20197.1 MAG: 50S ribosomal protein L27 [Candidatus Chisholmbacteria bacterium RIFCSPLOWO2_01_FULL_50_28]